MLRLEAEQGNSLFGIEISLYLPKGNRAETGPVMLSCAVPRISGSEPHWGQPLPHGRGRERPLVQYVHF